MAVQIGRFDGRRFEGGKLQKLNVLQTSRFFMDVYCLQPGQAQKAHQHAGSDKVYAVLEGRVRVSIGEEVAEVGPGEAVLAPAGVEHGVENHSAANAALLVFMAPMPGG